MGNRPRPDTAEERKREGAKRNEAWAKMSRAEKLAALDRRLGKGVGAARQRRALLGWLTVN